MIIKTLAGLAEPDEASLVIRPLDIDPARVAEGVAEYRQNLIAGFELIDEVPESTRSSYDRVRIIYSYGVLCYDLYTVAGDQARLVVEQALRDRFLPFYGGTVTFIDGADREHDLTARRFSELFDRDNPLVKGNWRLKLRSGRRPIRFNGMLASLLRWAREERLLGGQRDRWQDSFRVKFRNYAAHPEYHREMPDDAAADIFHLSELINQIWGTPGGTPVRREAVALAWTDTAIMYGLAKGFQIGDRLPADATCVVVLADPLDRTLGNSCDLMYEMTARPCEYLWGPGTWSDGAQWLSANRQRAMRSQPWIGCSCSGTTTVGCTCRAACASLRPLTCMTESVTGTCSVLTTPLTHSAINGRFSPERNVTVPTDSAATARQRISLRAHGRK